MSEKQQIWFITGASRGTGVDFTEVALAAGHAVVATGRDRHRVSKALGHANDLLAVKLDVTSSRRPLRDCNGMEVERTGIEPVTPCLQSRCSPS
jgi:NADP-dependent 3-hydroxy acid dehydrogenase YdfG